jgi:hypothetical protein
MASASAAERSQEDPALRKKRGQQVVLTFSGQVRRGGGGGRSRAGARPQVFCSCRWCTLFQDR